MPRPRPRVVLVHGAVERARGFDQVVEHLDDLDVLAYDRRGHGERWQEGTASLTADVDELVDVLEERPATVVGHSLGGLVALGASLRRPELVEAVALYETAIPWGEWWTPSARARMLAEIDVNTAAATEGPDPARLAVAWAACRRQVLDAMAGPFCWQDAAVALTTARGQASEGASARDADVVARHFGRGAVVVEGAGHRAHRTHPVRFAGFVRGCVPIPGG